MSHPFAEAIERGDVKKVQMMLAEDPELASAADWTPPPLHCAVLSNQPTIAEVLLDAGADLEALDPDRQTTALRYAVVYAKTEMVRLLIRRGANSGAIREDGISALELAKQAAEGAFEEFEDLPNREAYGDVLAALEDTGLEG